jgi:transglutaminase-like putative cysteine protease
MKRLKVVHTTRFHYSDDVTVSYNEARMLPAAEDGQFVLAAQIDISPACRQTSYQDYWGTRVVAFQVPTPHTELTLTSTSLVEVTARAAATEPMTWEELERVSASTVDFVEHVRQTSRTTPTRELDALARDTARSAADPAAAAAAVCRLVGESMQYLPGSTGVHSTAREAWKKRSGVCQDIAHVTLGALRAVGIPCRYISGYLHPRPEPVVGEAVPGESHAWVEWFAGGWHGFDPTNLIEIGDRHVLVGRGRDYDDVPPFRGVYDARSGESEQAVTVEITQVG